MVWTRCCTVLMVAFVWIGITAADEPEKPRLGQIVWHYPQYDVEIPNDEAHEARIEMIRVRMVDFEVDLTSRPIFLIQPFLNEMLVTVVELGCGDYQDGQLQLHNSERLDELFGTNTQTQAIGAMTSRFDSAPSKNLFFSIPSEPKFGFIPHRAFKFTDMEPPRLAPGPQSRRNIHKSRPEPLDIYHRYGNLPHRESDDYDAKYWELGKKGSAIAFSGLVDGQVFRYYPFALPAVETSPAVSELLRGQTELGGAMYTDFELIFGDVLPLKEAAGAGTHAGVSIELSQKRDGEWLDVPVPLQILPPKSSCQLTLQFVTKTSKRFRIEVQPVSKFNQPKAIATRLKSQVVPAAGKPKFECVTPRPLLFNYSTTQAFVKELNDSRRNYHSAAKDAIEIGLIDPAQLDFATRSSQSRQFAQALLLMDICYPKSAELQNGLSKLAVWLDALIEKHGNEPKKPKLSMAEEPLVSMAWPLLCNNASERAANIVVKAYGKRDTSLVTVALMIPETRTLLTGNYAPGLHECLHRNLSAQPQEISAEEATIATSVNFRNWEKIKLDMLDDTVLAVAAGAAGNKLIDKEVRRRINTTLPNSNIFALLVELSTNKAWQFSEDVCIKCEPLLASSDHVELVEAYTNYLSQVPRPQQSSRWSSTMNQLKKYPFSDTVRAAALRQSSTYR